MMMGAVLFRQTRIFVHPAAPFNGAHWAETLLGRVVEPVIKKYAMSLSWFWFSRYVQPRDGDCGDWEFSQIPDHFFDGDHRSIRFRYAIPDRDQLSFEQEAQELLDAAGAKISDFRDYPWVDDLGGDRFIGEDRPEERRRRRAEVLARTLSSVCALTLDCLQGPDSDGRFHLEVNESDGSPFKSSLLSVHHLFCNITDVPTHCFIGDLQGNVIPVRIRF